MNRLLLQRYLTEYKQNFAAIRREEAYKWQAIQHFQEVWNPITADFAEMLTDALSKTSNLMDSGNYFPKRMILKAAKANPALVRVALMALFDEDSDLEERMTTFRRRLETIVEQNSLGDNHYQDDRAIMVYLTLQHPDIYFFYKFTMLRDFCQRTRHDYRPKGGSFENITVYHEICHQLKSLLLTDDELIQLHREHLAAGDYFDGHFNILTQDFVYAVQSHLDEIEIDPTDNSGEFVPSTEGLETPLAADLDEPGLPERKEVKTYRILRDTNLALGVKRMYNFHCQICGETVPLHDRNYSEAHHIRPLGQGHKGPDDVSNIISVCPTHHVLLDYGAIELDLGDLSVLSAHGLNTDYIDYHNTVIYKGSAKAR